MLGSSLLRQTFKLHSDLREEVLDQILCRVITKCSASIDPFLNLLSDIVSDGPVLLTASANTQKLRDAFDYVSQLDLHTVRAVSRVFNSSLMGPHSSSSAHLHVRPTWAFSTCR